MLSRHQYGVCLGVSTKSVKSEFVFGCIVVWEARALPNFFDELAEASPSSEARHLSTH